MAQLRGGTTISGYIAYHEGNLTDEVIINRIKESGGEGSMINADMVDGKHADEFATANHTHSEWQQDASTTVKGVVKLNNTLTSNSITEAATAATVKTLNDLLSTKVNKSGDTMTDKLAILKNNITISDTLYSDGHLEVRTTDNSPASIGFHRVGKTAVALYHNALTKDQILRLRTSGGADISLIHDGWLGHNNGFNADMVDGKHATDFAPAGFGLGSPCVVATGDWNNYDMTGFYMGTALTNSPPALTGAHTWFYVAVRNHNSIWCSQEAIDFNGVSSWYRTKMNGTWGTWKRILDINNTGNTNGHFDTTATGPTGTARLNYSGYFFATRVYNAVYNDYAEYFEKGDELEPGDVVMLKEDSDKEEYVKTDCAYNKFVVGVVSDEYAHCIGGKGDGNDDEHYSPVGLAGRVRVKVIGKIKKGDLIVSSHINGVAMASQEYKPGTVIGKALENYDSNEVGKIRMLIFNS